MKDIKALDGESIIDKNRELDLDLNNQVNTLLEEKIAQEVYKQHFTWTLPQSDCVYKKSAKTKQTKQIKTFVLYLKRTLRQDVNLIHLFQNINPLSPSQRQFFAEIIGPD